MKGPEVDALFAQLDRWLQTSSAVVTSEGLGSWFYSARARLMLPALEKLALEHEVRIAYYVRPQHSALEAAWRQWGFREASTPSEYLLKRGRSLHFLATHDQVRRQAPHVSFEMRPFRRDLLEGADVVTDFAEAFLGIRDASLSSSDSWENRALPLELVNILRYAPAGHFWTSADDNEKLNQLRDFGAVDWPLPDNPDVTRSRAVLQSFCRREYEPQNVELIARLGWRTDHFVPPVPSSVDQGRVDLAELDRLWEPDASEHERMLLYHALSALLESRQPPRVGGKTEQPTRPHPLDNRNGVSRITTWAARWLPRGGRPPPRHPRRRFTISP